MRGAVEEEGVSSLTASSDFGKGAEAEGNEAESSGEIALLEDAIGAEGAVQLVADLPVEEEGGGGEAPGAIANPLLPKKLLSNLCSLLKSG